MHQVAFGSWLTMPVSSPISMEFAGGSCAVEYPSIFWLWEGLCSWILLADGLAFHWTHGRGPFQC